MKNLENRSQHKPGSAGLSACGVDRLTGFAGRQASPATAGSVVSVKSIMSVAALPAALLNPEYCLLNSERI